MSAHAQQLTRAVTEIERHAAGRGWDQPPRLYALAPTEELIRREPGLAVRLGAGTGAVQSEGLTPVEQELPDRSLEDVLATITWPDTVTGCALVVERIVLPPDAEQTMPDDPDDAVTWAQNHPGRTDVRIVVGVLRDGSRSSVLRVRGHDDDTDLIHDPDFSPDLGAALAETLAE
ncbi:MAG TPA: PPA1309 family protein [Jiangellaceae bacterium]|nr:PPA1309 family protein [Jiangellaceae bacterium]